MATQLYDSLKPKSDYIDKWRKITPEEYQKQLLGSSTVYVGNLSVFTKEEAIHELFSRCGPIKLFKLGLNKQTNTPAGFCFVEYYSHEDAAYAVDFLSHTNLDDRVIRVDWDLGFTEGRQYGRGKSGGQVRDEFRTYDDPGRGVQAKKPFNRDDNRREYNNDRKDYRRDYSHKNNDRDRYRERDREREREKDRDDSDSDDGNENYRRRKKD